MVAKHAVFSIFTIKSFVLRDEMTFCRRCCSIIMIICLNPLNVIDICYCQSVGKRHGFSSRHIAQVPTIEQCNTNISCMHGPNNFFSLTTILFFHVHWIFVYLFFHCGFYGYCCLATCITPFTWIHTQKLIFIKKEHLKNKCVYFSLSALHVFPDIIIFFVSFRFGWILFCIKFKVNMSKKHFYIKCKSVLVMLFRRIRLYLTTETIRKHEPKISKIFFVAIMWIALTF